MTSLGEIDRGDRPTVEIDYSKPREARVTPSKVIPRYRFNATGVGCKAHNKATCLCDVVVSAETPINHPLPLVQFGSIATKVNGQPTARNLVAWVETLLGCAEMSATLVERQDLDGVLYERPAYLKGEQTGWAKLGPEIRDDLKWYGTRKGITFSMVAHLVPDTFTQDERNHVRKLFNNYKTEHNRLTTRKVA